MARGFIVTQCTYKKKRDDTVLNMLMHNKMVNCITDMVLDYITEPVLIPLPLEDPDSSEVIDVSCGRAHTVVLTSEGGEYQQYLGIVIVRGEYQQHWEL